MMEIIDMGMRSKDEVIESEKFLQKVLDASLNGIYIYDVKLGKHVFVNKQYEILTGYTSEELKTMGKVQFFELIHPDDRPQMNAHNENLIQNTDEMQEIEYRFKIKSGKWIWCLSREDVFSRYKDGSVSQIIGSFLDISARKEFGQKLQKREDRYSELVQNANSAIIRWRRDGTITFFNEYAQRLFGYSAEEVIGSHGSLLAPQQKTSGADRAKLGRKIAKQPQRYIMNINENICRDGRRVWMAWTNKAILDQNGKVDEILSIGSDITVQKRAEESIRLRNTVLEGINRIFKKALMCQTEEELGGMCLAVAEEVTSSRFGFIGELNAEGRLDDIAISDPGWSVCKMANPTGHRIVPTGFEVHGIYGRVLQDGKGFYTNNPASHPDSIGLPKGHPPLESFMGVPLTHAGKTKGMVGVANRLGGYRDEDFKSLEMLAPAFVQALMSKKAEQAMRESEDKFSKAFYSSPIFLFICELETGIFVEVNDAYCTMVGYTREEMIGHSSLELGIISPGKRLEILQHFKKTGRIQNLELMITTKSDSIRFCLFSAETMEYRNKHCLVYSGFDITERKKAEEIQREYQKKLRMEVRKRTAEIKKQYRELEELHLFIRKLSQHTLKAMENDRKGLSKEIHDSIGGSLAAVKMLLESRLLHDDHLPPDGFMSLEKIVGHLTGLIEETRRISYQMRPLALEDYNFEKAIWETVETFKEFYPNVKVDMKIDISDGDIQEEIKTVIYRVTQEALNNIGKHSRADVVRVELFESKNTIFLKVIDDGCGFDVSKIYDTESPLQGYGMRSMKERAEICKGIFQVESEPGKGTSLSVSIPKLAYLKRTGKHRKRTRSQHRNRKKI